MKLRFYADKQCYYGRQPEAKPQRTAVPLRRGANPTKTVVGDTKDAWLRGQSGELYEHFDKRKPRR